MRAAHERDDGCRIYTLDDAPPARRATAEGGHASAAFVARPDGSGHCRIPLGGAACRFRFAC